VRNIILVCAKCIITLERTLPQAAIRQDDGVVAVRIITHPRVPRYAAWTLATVPSPHRTSSLALASRESILIQRKPWPLIQTWPVYVFIWTAFDAGVRNTRGLHLVRIRDVAFAILGFQLFLRLAVAAGLDGNGRLANSGEGDQGSIRLHGVTSLSCLGGQVLTEFEPVNPSRMVPE
jgi:hypothetical protein